MSKQRRRATDHDESTRQYLALMESTYSVELELALAVKPGYQPRGLHVLTISIVKREAVELEAPELLARGDVRTDDNKAFNSNVRYLLTVGMLRLMEQHFN